MRIDTIRIQNFRSFADETINLSEYNCFVGPNGSGKSSILAALNIFFRNDASQTSVTNLSDEDFHLKRTQMPIKITVTFVDLPEEAKTDLKAYVRQNQLVVSAIARWNEEIRSAEVQQFGSRRVVSAFKPWFEAEKEGTKVADLKKIFQDIREKYPDVDPANTKAEMQQSLRDFEEANPQFCELVESTDQFYGWSKGKNLLSSYIQWIYIPAVKDATEEEKESRATALGQLLQRTIRNKVDFTDNLMSLRQDAERRYQKMLISQQDLLKDLSKSLQKRLQEWSHPGAKVLVEWDFDETKSVVVNDPYAKIRLGEGPFIGDLARLGHGLQRSFIVSILHELASTNTEYQSNLILGFEEPELYQHPPQARYLAGLLEELSGTGNQILVTTHSPYFVSGRGFESVRLTRKDSSSGVSSISSMTHKSLSQRLADALGEEPRTPSSVMAAVQQIMQPSQSELFFSKLPVLVEGLEDMAYITTHLHITGMWSEFRKYGCHFVVCGGKSPMSRPLAIAKGLGIPTFCIFDGDGNKPQDEHKQRRDNSCLLQLCGHSDVDTFPDETFWGDVLVMWATQIEEEVRNELKSTTWDEAKRVAREELELHKTTNPKNSIWITHTLESLNNRGIQSNLLEKVCDRIFDFARSL